MRTYLVMTPPGGHEPDHRSTVVIPDGFAWLALFFPWLWLLSQRLWMGAFCVFVLQVGTGVLAQMPGFGFAGTLAGFALSLLVALEGRNFRAEHLMRRGWSQDAVIQARDIETAEEIHFSNLPEPVTAALPSTDWARNAQPTAASRSGPALGLFDHHEGGR